MIASLDSLSSSIYLEICSFLEGTMLYWAVIFFIIAIVAALFGFGGIAAGAQTIAVWLFWIFIIIFLVSLILGLLRRGGRY